MNNPGVSIVVPTYNVEKYIRECIDSLINQTHKNLEIILVDDGSTDSTGAICDEYAEKDSRVKVIHKENGGSSSSREAGINFATSQFCMIVDGDDWLDPEAIEDCVRAMRENEGCECVLFPYVKEYPNSSVRMHIFEGDRLFFADEGEDKIYRRLFGLLDEELLRPELLAPIGSCCMKLYRTEDARRGRYYHTNEVGSAEDALFNMHALFGVRNYVYIDKPYYHYRKTSTSLTATYRPRLQEQWNRLYDIMESIILEKGLGERYKKAISNYIALNVIGAGSNEFSNRNNAFFGKRRKIKTYLKNERVHNALIRLDRRGMPLKWRVFMFFARHRCAFMLSLMFLAIGVLKKRG